MYHKKAITAHTVSAGDYTVISGQSFQNRVTNNAPIRPLVLSQLPTNFIKKVCRDELPGKVSEPFCPARSQFIAFEKAINKPSFRYAPHADCSSQRPRPAHCWQPYKQAACPHRLPQRLPTSRCRF